MNRKDHGLAIVAAVAACAAPAAALADGAGTTKPAQYNVKGVYAGDGIVSVEKANGHARKAGWKGQDVVFDLSTAELRVADVNGDGTQDLADVQVGDRVKVKSRLPKRDPGAGPYVAQRLVDKTNPAGSDEEPDQADVTQDGGRGDDGE